MTDVNVLSNTRFGDSVRKVVHLIADNISRTAASFSDRLLYLLFDVITIEGLANRHADNRHILMLHTLAILEGVKAE